MSVELLATIIGTVVTIATLGVTIYLSGRSTQKILTDNGKLLERIVRVQETSQKTLDKVAHLLHKVNHTSEKIALHSAVDLGLQGVEIAENIASEEEAKKLGEVVKYNSKLKVCYYKPKEAQT